MAFRSAYNLTGKVRAGGGVGAGQVSAVVAGSGWNPSDKIAQVTLSESNLRAVVSAPAILGGVRGTTSHTGTGVWQFEVLLSNVTQDQYTGVGLGTASANINAVCGSDAFGWARLLYSSTILHSGSTTAGFGAVALGDYIGVVWDIPNRILTFYKNGVANGQYTAGTGAPATTDVCYPMSAGNGGTWDVVLNTGATAFAYPIGGATAWG